MGMRFTQKCRIETLKFATYSEMQVGKVLLCFRQRQVNLPDFRNAIGHQPSKKRRNNDDEPSSLIFKVRFRVQKFQKAMPIKIVNAVKYGDVSCGPPNNNAEIDFAVLRVFQRPLQRHSKPTLRPRGSIQNPILGDPVRCFDGVAD